MQLLTFLVVLLAIAAIAGVVWLHFGQHTEVEVTGPPETAAGD